MIMINAIIFRMYLNYKKIFTKDFTTMVNEN